MLISIAPEAKAIIMAELCDWYILELFTVPTNTSYNLLSSTYSFFFFLHRIAKLIVNIGSDLIASPKRIVQPNSAVRENYNSDAKFCFLT